MVRRTAQREAIRTVLSATERPLTVAEIHQRASRQVNGLGLRTVFRNIKTFAEEGWLVKLDYPGQPLRYEWVEGRHHPHFICYTCNKTYNFKEEAPDVPYTPPPGFRVEGQEVVFYGQCPDCGRA